MRHISTTLAAGIAVMVLGSGAGSACEIKVRDAAFRTPRDMHRLCVMGHAHDTRAQAIFDELSTWIHGLNGELNLELEAVNVDDPNIEWSRYGVPRTVASKWPVPPTPVVVLVGHNLGNGDYFVIDSWEPGPTAEELDVLSQSPARDNLSQQLGKHLAVLLYVPGDGPDAGRARDVIEQTRSRWSLKNDLGVSEIEVDRANYGERTLLSFAGVPPTGQDWVGVVFGRGKLMAPPLQGEDITGDRLDELIGQLEANCSCSKPLPSMGVDVPLVWQENLDASVIALAADDTESPADTPAILDGLAITSAVPSADTGDALGTPLFKTAIWTVGGLCLVVLAFSVAMRLRG